jgi:hypothetical protein
MKKTFTLLNLIPIMMLLLLVSCFKDEAPQVQQLDVGTFEGGCKIDTERLKNLLKEHVYGEIDCIEKNFEQFSKLVTRDEPDYINKADLTKFVNHFFKEQSKDIVQALDLLFDINVIALRGPKAKIHNTQLSALFRIIKTLNKHGVPLNALFTQLDQGRNYWEIRDSMRQVVTRLSSDLLAELPQSGADQKLDIIVFLEQMKKNLDLTDEQLDLELIRSMLFAKKLFVGGNPAELASSELVAAVSKLPSIAMAAFDFMYLQDNPVNSTKEKDKVMLLSFKALLSSLHQWNAEEVILTHNDLMVVGNEFMNTEDDPTTPDDETFRFKDLEGTLVNIKEFLIHGSPSHYTYGDIQKVMGWVNLILERFYFFDLVYEHHQAELDNKKPIVSLPRPELKEFEVFDRPSVFRHWDNFSYILKTFRTYHDENMIQYFTNDYYRSINGFKIKSILLFALNLAVDNYGHSVKDPATGAHLFNAVTLAQLRTFLLHLEDAFRALDMWPKYFERFLSEAQNSSDLFQYNSDGDGVINVVEATEYVSNIIHARTLAFDIKDALSAVDPVSGKELCKIVPDEDGLDAFLVPCYRENFFTALFERLKYRKYFQKLYDYTVHFSKDEIRKYIIDVESFAKEENDSEIPMSVVDLGRLIVSFSNIEGIFLRYDKDQSNILERSELDPGFEVFKKVLMTFGNLKPDQTKIALSTFLYIIKTMESPEDSKVKFVFFHLFGKKKDISARRMNVGAILALVAKATIPPNP